MKKLKDIFKEREAVILKGIEDGIIMNMEKESVKEIVTNLVGDIHLFLSTMHAEENGELTTDMLMEELADLRESVRKNIFEAEIEDFVYYSIIKEHDDYLIQYKEDVECFNTEEKMKSLYCER
ncbi:MAG: hypothetical protein PQJ61_14525 [Spirochaetales bacterium]|uniref:Uncharacterized protein n=1 Tax=Candidatus Thalassospirochaeta sargassi TaxID=3119039 RepID=A0AAJ1IEV3_9SPIO|nr:hypothetical protein [Spirochaetales bacterium]